MIFKCRRILHWFRLLLRFEMCIVVNISAAMSTRRMKTFAYDFSSTFVYIAKLCFHLEMD